MGKNQATAEAGFRDNLPTAVVDNGISVQRYPAAELTYDKGFGSAV